LLLIGGKEVGWGGLAFRAQGKERRRHERFFFLFSVRRGGMGKSEFSKRETRKDTETSIYTLSEGKEGEGGKGGGENPFISGRGDKITCKVRLGRRREEKETFPLPPQKGKEGR